MKMKVLIVDDTEFYIKTYRIKLLSEGYEVKSATDGLGALKQLKADKPDILLLDLMMPVMDGFKVLQTMKSDPGLEDIPVVVFSAKGDMEEVSKAMEAGASDFLVKATTTPNKVVEKINKVLSR